MSACGASSRTTAFPMVAITTHFVGAGATDRHARKTFPDSLARTCAGPKPVTSRMGALVRPSAVLAEHAVGGCIQRPYAVATSTTFAALQVKRLRKSPMCAKCRPFMSGSPHRSRSNLRASASTGLNSADRLSLFSHRQCDRG